MIVSQIVQEALTLIFVAGYFGLVAAVGVLELASSLASGSDFFKNPGVHFSVAIIAFTVLMFFGSLAGFFPAMRALKIKAVDALRAD